MVPDSVLHTIGLFVIGAAVLCVLAAVQMRRRAALFEQRTSKQITIQAYVAAREDWGWRDGESAALRLR